MKKYTITNIVLLASLTLFSACSSSSAVKPHIKTETQSVQSIMGIETTQGVLASSTPTTVPTYSEPRLGMYASSARGYTRVSPAYSRTEQVVIDEPVVSDYVSVVPQSSIEVVAMPSSNYTQPQVYQDESIEVISYASQQPVIDRIYQQNSEMLAQEIETRAKELLGIKYVWGATGPNKYDCSGFTQKIFRDAGIKIPRVSRDQAKVGQYVTFQSLRKGDMVFFDTQKHPTGKVTHVGIYLGNGNFIHASSGAKKVVIYNFNKKTFNKKRFLWGRRVINDTHLASL